MRIVRKAAVAVRDILFKANYRLSRLKFFLYTLAYCVFVVVVGFIVAAAGGSGGWTGLLLGLVLFLLYLNYVARPRLRDMGHSQWKALTFLIPFVNLLMLLVLLRSPGTQIGNQGGTKGIRKPITMVAGLLAAPIILAVGLVTAFVYTEVILFCVNEPWGCSDSKGSPVEPMLAERDTVQTAMDSMMVDKNLTTVTPNDDSNNSLGVNTWTGLPEGVDAEPLVGYLPATPTEFYYCWNSKGQVYTQNKKDGVKAAPDDAEKQRPCKKSPTDPTLQTAQTAAR